MQRYGKSAHASLIASAYPPLAEVYVPRSCFSFSWIDGPVLGLVDKLPNVADIKLCYSRA